MQISVYVYVYTENIMVYIFIVDLVKNWELNWSYICIVLHGQENFLFLLSFGKNTGIVSDISILVLNGVTFRL